MEKRNSNRHKTDQSIVCMFFTSHGCDDTFDGRMQNYCDSGMYAELQTCFKEGTILLVRTTSSTPERLPAKIEEGFRTISLVEVKWSKPISADGVFRYGTGLKHLVV
ncbi:MAG: hypothetical protein HY895_15810 [Deltaproteobacteria bacterium]|nr:hypothetical protein [Deltaproteobacteria bacterium]